MKAANLGVKFLLELCAFAALGYWGAGVGSGVVAVLVAVGAPAVAIALWSVLAAPRSPRRLPTRARVPFELGVFGLAAIALLAAGATAVAIAFASVAVVNAAALAALHQLEA